MEAAQTVNENIRTLAEIATVLEDLGYEVGAQPDFVAVKVPGGDTTTYTAVVTVDEAREKVVVTCEIARYGDIPEDKLPDLLAAQSDANTRIDPFAFATLTNLDDPERADAADWLIVLIESLPLGDLAACEIESVMADLQRALPEVRQVMDLVKE